MKILYYCVLKNYKGVFKKKHKGNNHLFLIPTEKEYLYLALIGEYVGRENEYACKLIVRLPFELGIKFLKEEVDHFGDRFVIVDKVPTEAKTTGDSTKVTVGKKGKYILSKLSVFPDPNFKKSDFILKGKLNLETEEVSPQTVQMVKSRKAAFLSRIRK